jgi:hypothetical protein
VAEGCVGALAAVVRLASPLGSLAGAGLADEVAAGVRGVAKRLRDCAVEAGAAAASDASAIGCGGGGHSGGVAGEAAEGIPKSTLLALVDGELERFAADFKAAGLRDVVNHGDGGYDI